MNPQLKSFLDKLAATKHLGWMNNNGLLRLLRKQGDSWYCDCPISAVSGDHNHFNKPKLGGHVLGLSDVMTKMIVRAADSANGHDVELRKQICSAIGVLP